MFYYCHTCKNHAKLWLMHAKAFERDSKTNIEHTVAVLCQRHDFILLNHFFDYVFFLIRNFNSFYSSFYYRNWPENSHHHAYSRQQAHKEWLIFPSITLIPGTTLIKNGSSFPPPRLFRATCLFRREEQFLGGGYR